MRTESSGKAFQILERDVKGCRLCPRLVGWREKIAEEKVLRYNNMPYWGKPVPGFGVL